MQSEHIKNTTLNSRVWGFFLTVYAITASLTKDIPLHRHWNNACDGLAIWLSFKKSFHIKVNTELQLFQKCVLTCYCLRCIQTTLDSVKETLTRFTICFAIT